MNAAIRACAALLTAVLFSSGCAATYEQTVAFNPTEPIRIAVLPFARVDEQGTIVSASEGTVFGNVPGISRDFGEAPEVLLRTFVVSELEASALDLLSIALVDSRLSHTGYVKADLSPDLAKMYAASATELCSRVFDCDAVLYGTLERWDQSYYGVETVTGVGYELTLVSAKDGATLFSAKVEDTDRRGLTGIPTGLSSIVIEPILGLDDQITVELAQRSVKRVFEPLRAENRPEFLESAPPAIFAAAHDHPDRPLTPGSPLTVLVYGSPDLTASFEIEGYALGFPMTERDPGHYVGSFYALPGERFGPRPVRVSLTDRFGRTSNQTLVGALSTESGS